MRVLGQEITKVRVAGVDVARVRVRSVDEWTSAPSAPDPISYFDWHEGGGSTTTSIVSSHVLTASNPSTAWNGQSANGTFTGNIGDTPTTTWTLAVEFTLDSGSSWRNLLHTSDAETADEIWLQLNGATLNVWTSAGASTGFDPAFPTVASNVRTMLAVTCDGTTQRVYLDGELVTSRTQATILEPTSAVIRDSSENLNGYVHTVRFWDIALSDAEVAALISA
ncbi:hypothetical protein OPTIMUS_49 [Mycobacterium phage Optimus]|uniref:Uncharacterized protein n=2 Tax=Omegavirus TaxID=1623292 RepID=G1DAI8_9CAUD|nr:minor tail protein [Mycobacterium phage Optimus]YP_009636219.1 minor tail protein [Mycobacterium phage Baka]AEJ92129.1 hypothetical protein OPTIMUS_49 [Mycobacterium phage Optimus]AEK08105.1 hypothetical protein PBI_BAKA_48 [Mycobacterium phage Baka]ATN88854.1 hypothetical protein SEA_DMPSTRDIVER_45 [Mycobacterium phage DmpstrDiver]